MPDDPNNPGGTPPAAAPPAAVAVPPTAAPGTPAPDREKWIPRERFDEVNAKVETLQQQVAYLTSAPPTQVQDAPAPEADGLPKEYRSWDEWHATDPGAAIDWRSRQAFHQERQKSEFVDGRKQFLKEVYAENANLVDPMKRAADPTYQAFTKLLSENPASASSHAGLKQLWKLAKVESGQSPAALAAAHAAGATTEQQRQAAAAAGFAPAGTGTPQLSPGAQAPTLTPEQKKTAARFGMTDQEYLAKNQDAPQRITMKYEKAKRG